LKILKKIIFLLLLISYIWSIATIVTDARGTVNLKYLETYNGVIINSKYKELKDGSIEAIYEITYEDKYHNDVVITKKEILDSKRNIKVVGDSIGLPVNEGENLVKRKLPIRGIVHLLINNLITFLIFKKK
jgi:hypothetical protein